MDFRIDEDQRALRDALRSFCQGRLSIDRLRELEGTGEIDRALWLELAEMGVFNLRISTDAGGVGLGSADAVLVFAELGRALAPGPLVWTHLAADLLPGAADGSLVVGGLDLCDGSEGPILVEHLASLDRLIVLRDDGVSRIDPDSLEFEPIATPLDPFTPVSEVRTLPGGERVADAATARRMRRDGAMLVAAQLLGIAEATLEMANAYALQREQFGRVIGSFQALKHLLADCFVRQEAARAAVYAAGATVDDPEVGDVDEAVSAAKLNAGEAAWKNARACIQVHGGMGFTWEVPAHYFLKRTRVLECVFGTIEEHADAVAELVAARA